MLLASLFSFFGGNTDPYKKNQALMDSIVNNSIKQLSDRYGLIPVGRGKSVKEEKSSMESVSLRLDRVLSKDEARVLIVEIVELFLHNINENQNVSHFLYNNPFTYKNFEFRVFIYDKDGSDIFDPYIGLVSLTPRGTVSYVTYKAGSSVSRESWLEEPYEEAYRIATQGASSN